MTTNESRSDARIVSTVPVRLPAAAGLAVGEIDDEAAGETHAEHHVVQSVVVVVAAEAIAGVLDDALILTIDRAYFDLTGGLERWLYRLVRKHGGRQTHGWSFDLAHLHLKSGSLSPLRRFRFELRAIVQRQPLPGYHLALIDDPNGRQRLIFRPTKSDCLVTARRRRGGVR